MSFGDVAARLKKKQEEQAPPPVERDHEEVHTLRARILGVLIRDARQASGKSQIEVAEGLKVSEDHVRDWEYGRVSPSLPELELLAFFLGVPVSQFWNTKTLSTQEEERTTPDLQEYEGLRDRVIGALLTLARKESKLSQEEVAKATGLTVEQLAAYELGQQSVPFPELTSLSTVLKKPLSYFLENTGRLGGWLALQEEYNRFSQLPEDIRAFVTQPVNQAFIEIAIRLSRIPVHELRTVGENILNITF